MQYVAIIHHLPGDQFFVSFPDVTGVSIPCSSRKRAHDVATSVINNRVRLYKEQGNPVPEPFSEEDIAFLNDIFGACSVLVVQVPEEKSW